MKSTKSIIICGEESQVICAAFRHAGFSNTYSCDLLPTRGNPDWHIIADMKEVLLSQDFDLAILHPPCTALALSGNRTYGYGKPLHFARQRDLAWTLDLWDLAKRQASHAAIENPLSVLFKHIGYMFYCHPWQHGHPEQKQTGFGLHNLLPLTPTDIVKERSSRIHNLCPSKTRQRDRSETFTGIANAIVAQWGSYILEE